MQLRTVKQDRPPLLADSRPQLSLPSRLLVGPHVFWPAARHVWAAV